MRALVVESFGTAPRVRDVPEPVCPAHGVVVRVEGTGLCRSDWHAVMGHDDDVRLPHVPGHEFAGVVAEVGGDVAGWSVGDRVTAPFVHACGTCRECLAGDQQVCARQTQPGFTRWGSFAERVVVDHAAVNLVALPEGLDAVAAAALGCRFATAFRAVVEVGRVRAGEWVAVHGCGGVGLSAILIARACGARVVAVDVAPSALALASRSGAEALVDAAEGQGVRDVVPDGVQVSLDAFGSEATCAASIACLARRGRHVQIGLLPPVAQPAGLPRVPMHLVIARELAVLGSHGLAARSYPALLGLITAGRLDPTVLVARTVSLDEAGPLLVAMGQAPPTGVVVAVPEVRRDKCSSA